MQIVIFCQMHTPVSVPRVVRMELVLCIGAISTMTIYVIVEQAKQDPIVNFVSVVIFYNHVDVI